MSRRSSKMKLIVLDEEGNEKINYLWGMDVRKVRKIYNTIEQYHDETKEVGGAEITTRVYCTDKADEGYGWAEQLKKPLMELFETSGCFHADNKSTQEELMDAICIDDQQLLTVFWGNKDKKVDGYFQTCRESSLKLV